MRQVRLENAASLQGSSLCKFPVISDFRLLNPGTRCTDKSNKIEQYVW